MGERIVESGRRKREEDKKEKEEEKKRKRTVNCQRGNGKNGVVQIRKSRV